MLIFFELLEVPFYNSNSGVLFIINSQLLKFRVQLLLYCNVIMCSKSEV